MDGAGEKDGGRVGGKNADGKGGVQTGTDLDGGVAVGVEDVQTQGEQSGGSRTSTAGEGFGLDAAFIGADVQGPGGGVGQNDIDIRAVRGK